MCDIVYHYTSPDGILGILINKTLRFTDCQYLNDKGEFIYIRKPLEKAYKEIRKKRNKTYDFFKDFITKLFARPYDDFSLRNGFDENQSSHDFDTIFKSKHHYVLCASMNPDTANMWSYYVKNGVYQGYNLGIDRTYIKEWFTSHENNEIDFIEGKVIYDESTQIKLIYDLLEDLFAQYDENAITSHELFTDLYAFIHEKKLFFKNPAFSSEEEYRFILRVDKKFTGSKDLSIDFRVGKSGIITPYIKWKFKLSDKERLFKQITLAPMIESDLAKESFNRFLAATVQQSIDIKQSSINLRY